MLTGSPDVQTSLQYRVIPMNTRTVCIRMDADLHEIVKDRAEHNRRTITAEMMYLIEVGLGAGNESVKDLIKLLHRADRPALEADD